MPIRYQYIKQYTLRNFSSLLLTERRENHSKTEFVGRHLQFISWITIPSLLANERHNRKLGHSKLMCYSVFMLDQTQLLCTLYTWDKIAEGREREKNNKQNFTSIVLCGDEPHKEVEECWMYSVLLLIVMN